jgi:hypothetical protein
LAAVGAFVIGGVLLFAVGLFLIGNRRMLFAETLEVYAEFSEIAALANGAKVRVAGMDAGEVTEIHVPAGPTAKFRVRMTVREDLHHLVRTDSIASTQTEGLVGAVFVYIGEGTDAAPPGMAGGTIPGRDPFQLSELMEQASETVTLITQTVQGSVNGIDAKVVGIVDAAIPSFSKRVIYAHIEPLQKLIRMPGRYTELWFEANKAGDFPVLCAEYCGTSHSDMITHVIVHEEGGYEAWLKKVEEEIDNLDQLLPAFSVAPDNMERMRSIRRVFHTLKISGRLVCAKLLVEFAWKI